MLPEVQPVGRGECSVQKVPTPFLVADAKDGPAGTPVRKGPLCECSWCGLTFPPPPVFKNQHESETHKSKQKSEAEAQEAAAGETAPKGSMAPHAACILMKCLYGARMARFDLLRAIAHLACYITRWMSECDRRLYRLMCYIHSTKHLRMIGWVGDDGSKLQPQFVC